MQGQYYMISCRHLKADERTVGSSEYGSGVDVQYKIEFGRRPAVVQCVQYSELPEMDQVVFLGTPRTPQGLTIVQCQICS